MAVPTLRSTSSAAAQTDPTFSVAKPAGAVDDDLLVAVQVSNLGGVGTPPDTPTNWELLPGRSTFSVGAFDFVCFYRVVAGDGASYTFNGPGGSPAGDTNNVWITCWEGAAAAPEEMLGNSGVGTTATALSVTTDVADEAILCAFAIGANVGETITPDSITDIGTIGGVACLLDAAHTSQASAGATGNKTATISGIGTAWGAILIAIPPAAAPEPPGGGAGGWPVHFPYVERTAGVNILRRRVSRKL